MHNLWDLWRRMLFSLLTSGTIFLIRHYLLFHPICSNSKYQPKKHTNFMFTVFKNNTYTMFCLLLASETNIAKLFFKARKFVSKSFIYLIFRFFYSSLLSYLILLPRHWNIEWAFFVIEISLHIQVMQGQHFYLLLIRVVRVP